VDLSMTSDRPGCPAAARAPPPAKGSGSETIQTVDATP
jgi:hypothetical protein